MRPLYFSMTALVATALGGCAGDSMVAPQTLQLLSVSPPASAVGVAVSSSVGLTFNQPMMAGMEALFLLHEGSVTGSVVAGVASWSSNRETLTFVPNAPLAPRTTYVIHLAADMRGAGGARLDHRACNTRGGRTVSSDMMGGQSGMMGNGWQAADGTYGMVFTFTTGQ